MNNLNNIILACVITLFMCNSAFAVECISPNTPNIPTNKDASKDELIAGQKSLKAFQASLATYRDCLAAKSDAVNELAEDADAQKAALVALYNSSVDAETLAAEQFNTAVRAYKANQAK